MELNLGLSPIVSENELINLSSFPSVPNYIVATRSGTMTKTRKKSDVGPEAFPDFGQWYKIGLSFRRGKKGEELCLENRWIEFRVNGNDAFHDDFLQQQFLVGTFPEICGKGHKKEVGKDKAIQGGGQGNRDGCQDNRGVSDTGQHGNQADHGTDNTKGREKIADCPQHTFAVLAAQFKKIHFRVENIANLGRIIIVHQAAKTAAQEKD